MKTIQTKTIISASPERIWNVLMDFASYPKWNSFIRSIEGTPEVGSILKNEIHLEGQKPQVFKPEVLVVKENRHFVWKGKLFVKGLFDGEHHFRLEKIDDNRTEFIHEEFFTGILVRPLLAMISDKTINGFEAMNEALAKRVETITPKHNTHEAQS